MKLDGDRRKQSKKTLWGEELDSEYGNNFTPSFDPFFSRKHTEGKKYKCTYCGNAYENHETEIYKNSLYCRACAQGLYHYDD
ncbi:hypothetical protein KW850_02130 [Bacillus sp. sid0103]|uniref:hypothetical protein n=1 Tax=Bacillus sp. sid0103 TaxID=2856337 RepID=UPI001C45B61D|nr:hypothetical protein [Bacillus sp. sid0103]MBV7504065.1 hypothetical protein [Bacillus sp. sid0103]